MNASNSSQRKHLKSIMKFAIIIFVSFLNKILSSDGTNILTLTQCSDGKL